MQEEGGVHTKSSDLDKISASYQSLHLSENQQVSKLNTVKWTPNWKHTDRQGDEIKIISDLRDDQSL